MLPVNEDNIKKYLAVRIWWTLCIVCMIFIFMMSGQDGTESSELSLDVTVRSAKLITRDFNSLPAAERDSIVRKLHPIIRKLAHFTIFGVLGFLLMGALCSHNKKFFRNFFIALFIAVVYAASDEMHQLFVSGRGSATFDVLIDSLGAAAGIMFMLAIRFIWHKSTRSIQSPR